MGYTFAEITLSNLGDVTMAQRGIIKETEIRQTTLTAIVDTGAATLIINEEICRKLGLAEESSYEARLADGSTHLYAKTEPVQIQWKNRDTVCRAVVVPNAKETLLGVIPLEDMDLTIHPSKQELVGVHGDEMLFRV